jgi:hypothetical protein
MRISASDARPHWVVGQSPVSTVERHHESLAATQRHDGAAHGDIAAELGDDLPDGIVLVDRVQLIQRLYAAGLNSRAIADLLPCVQTGVATPEMLERLVAEEGRISSQIDELIETRDRLRGVIAIAERHARVPAHAG